MRGQKGITLVALVITIIVLLILAGISIAALSGDNGILSRASGAKAKNEIGEAKDQIALLANEKIAEYYERKYVSHETITDSIETIVMNAIDGATFTGADVTVNTTEKTITVKSKSDSTVTAEGEFYANGGINWT